MIINNLDDEVVSAYLENIITKGIHVWRFKINHKDVWDAIGIRNVTSSPPVMHDYLYHHNIGYAFLLGGWFTDPDNTAFSNWAGRGMNRCKNGDILSMIVDCNKWTLSYEYDGKHIRSCGIKPGKYKAGITLYEEGCSYSLMSHQKIY